MLEMRTFLVIGCVSVRLLDFFLTACLTVLHRVSLLGSLVLEGPRQHRNARLSHAHQHVLEGSAGQDRRRLREQRGQVCLF